MIRWTASNDDHINVVFFNYIGRCTTLTYLILSTGLLSHSSCQDHLAWYHGNFSRSLRYYNGAFGQVNEKQISQTGVLLCFEVVIFTWYFKKMGYVQKNLRGYFFQKTHSKTSLHWHWHGFSSLRPLNTKNTHTHTHQLHTSAAAKMFFFLSGKAHPTWRNLST